MINKKTVFIAIPIASSVCHYVGEYSKANVFIAILSKRSECAMRLVSEYRILFYIFDSCRSDIFQLIDARMSCNVSMGDTVKKYIVYRSMRARVLD